MEQLDPQLAILIYRRQRNYDDASRLLQGQEPSLERDVVLASLSLDRHNDEEALLLIEDIVTKWPERWEADDIVIPQLYAETKIKLGQYREARAILQEPVRLASTGRRRKQRHQLYSTVALSYMYEGHLGKAIQALTNAETDIRASLKRTTGATDRQIGALVSAVFSTILTRRRGICCRHCRQCIWIVGVAWC